MVNGNVNVDDPRLIDLIFQGKGGNKRKDGWVGGWLQTKREVLMKINKYKRNVFDDGSPYLLALLRRSD
jgi:hypothetical protein